MKPSSSDLEQDHIPDLTPPKISASNKSSPNERQTNVGYPTIRRQVIEFLDRLSSIAIPSNGQSSKEQIPSQPLCFHCADTVSKIISKKESSGQHTEARDSWQSDKNCPLCQLKMDCCPGERDILPINTKTSLSGVNLVRKTVRAGGATLIIDELSGERALLASLTVYRPNSAKTFTNEICAKGTWIG